MANWEKADNLVPASLQMFCRIQNEAQIYAVIQSCHSKCTKHSVLTNIWIKEYQDDSSKTIKALTPYVKDDSCAGRVPLLRIIPCEAIHSHCLLMPLANTSQQIIQVKFLSTWADEFFTIE